MKKIILILILFTAMAYSQVAVSGMDSITTMITTDLFWINKDVGSSTFAHRQLSWTNLRSEMIDYIDGLANTWALKQTFSSGATFPAGANGKVSFADSVQFDYSFYTSNFFPKSANGASIGWPTQPYYKIYASFFVPVNTEGNDSCVISYDDSLLTFSKDVSIPNLTLTESLDMDSTAGFQNFQITPFDYTPGDVTDSVITIATLRSNIRLVPPGDMTNIENLVMPAPFGQIVILYHTDADDSVTFEAGTATGAQVFIMGSNFIMDQYNSIAFMLISVPAGSVKGAWMELWRIAN